MKIVDLTGKKYPHWTVLRRDGYNLRNKSPTWTMRCSCSKIVRRVIGTSIRNGDRTRCRACAKRASIARHTTHGMSHSSEYGIWQTMTRRCSDRKVMGWPDYGGRGICVYEPWRKSFAEFIAYVGRRPSTEHTLDRIDNDGDYEPGNVRWATRAQQRRNMVRRSDDLRELLCADAFDGPAHGNVMCEAVTAVVDRASVEKTVRGALVVLDLGDGDIRTAYFVAPHVERKDRCILRMFDAPFEYEQHVLERELVAVADK